MTPEAPLLASQVDSPIPDVLHDHLVMQVPGHRQPHQSRASPWLRSERLGALCAEPLVREGLHASGMSRA